MSNRGCDDLRTLTDLNGIAGRDDSIAACIRGGLDTGFEIVKRCRRKGLELETQDLRGCLSLLELEGKARIVGIPQHSDAIQARKSLFEYFKPLRAQVCRDQAESCDISPWPRKTGDNSGANRIADGCKHDG